MKKGIFGRTGITMPAIGLGAWQLGGDWGPMDEPRAQSILTAAVDAGVCFIDTADVYGHGLSEERIGRFLKGCSEKIFVATKLGRFPEPGWPKNFSLNVFRRHTENSLRRLQRDVLDLTQVHCIPGDFLLKGELWEWLGLLKKEGKIKNFGLSVETVDEALFCLQQEGVTSLQIIFNVFRRKPIEALFAQAKAKKVALIIRLPLASGLLSGKFSADKVFPENDHRNYNANGQQFNVGETFCGIPFAKGVELVKELKDFVPPGMSLTQMALRWILDFEAVSMVIPGATSPKQVQENTTASQLSPLPKVLHEQLADFYNRKVSAHIRGKY